MSSTRDRLIALLAAACLAGCSAEEVEGQDEESQLNLADGTRAPMATCPNGGTVAPEVPGFGASIDDYAVYDGQKTCDSTPKAGVVAFRDLILATYPCTGSSGISRECSSGGTSEHKEGRAWDWAVNYPHPAPTALLAWLLATDASGNTHAMARRFGIMYMIWNRQIWKSYQSAKGWQHYTGANDHTDHVHFSFSWDGALKKTSYWTGDGTVVPATDAAPPKPTTPDAAPISPDAAPAASEAPLPAAAAPVGGLESISCDLISGWAQDLSSKTSPVTVEVYFDARPTEPGSEPHTVTANLYRDDLCTSLGSCAHGFLVQVPDVCLDGNTHQVFAYALDAGGVRHELHGSPSSFACATTDSAAPEQSSPSPADPPGSTGTSSTTRVLASCSISGTGGAGAIPILVALVALLGRRLRPRSRPRLAA